jgi:hypothetical protein
MRPWPCFETQRFRAAPQHEVEPGGRIAPELALNQTAPAAAGLSLAVSNIERHQEYPMHNAYQRHVPSRAEIVVGKAADAWRRWRGRRAVARFMRQCPEEAERVARDLKVDRSSLLEISGGGPPALLNRRLYALDINPERLQRAEPRIAQDLVRCCALCGCKPRCARDLVRRPDSDIWRTYCANASTLEALRPQYAKPSLVV